LSFCGGAAAWYGPSGNLEPTIATQQLSAKRLSDMFESDSCRSRYYQLILRHYLQGMARNQQCSLALFNNIYFEIDFCGIFTD
jgi:hypothetical protein